MRDNKVNVLKKMLGMLLVAPVMLSLSLFAAEVHHWELDENDTSEIYADSIGDANGTCTGFHCPTPTVGLPQLNGAQDFNATEVDRIDVTNSGNFDWVQDDNATITFWMKTETNATNNQVMIGRANTSGILWFIGIDGSAAGRAETNATGNIRVAVVEDKTLTGSNRTYNIDSGLNNSVTDGKWHHIAFVLTKTEIEIYVDGAFDFNVSRTPASDLIASSEVNFGSINLSGNDYPYNGSLDDITLYDVALEASEIKANYDAIVSPPAPEPDPEPDTTVSTSDGGGCTYNPDSKNFDMMFLLMIALGLFYPFRRRFIK